VANDAKPDVKPREKWPWRIAKSAARVYLGVCLVVALIQTKLIFPGASTQGKKDSIVRPIEGTELVRMKTPEGDEVVAMFGKAKVADPTTRPTVLYFYGNGMCLADSFAEFQAFRRAGANVMIPDFLGYGMSGGSAGEKGVYATAEASYAHLMSRDDVDKSKIIVAGWSLGAAAAIELASKHRVAGLMTFSAFTSMGDMARKTLPVFPTAFFLRHHFENEIKIRGIDVPTLIVHGRHDRIIPFDMSRRLREASASKSLTYLPIDEADHNDLFEVGADEIWPAVSNFLEAPNVSANR
jgi:pimeloyl-ACP methyl ester carboxylesterase